MSLTGMAQITTFKCVVQGWMGFHVDGPVLELTTIINDLWELSKEATPDDHDDFQERQRCLNARIKELQNGPQGPIAEYLTDKLRQMAAASHDDTPIGASANSPLNIIMPAYETMWRVVFFALMEVYVRPMLQPVCDQSYLPALIADAQSLMQTPTSPISQHRTLEAFIKETLRLYPPTKRVHRSFMQDEELPACVENFASRVDLEHIHRDSAIWGANSTQFRPLRFFKLSEDQRAAYMPFSQGPLKCIAKEKFAVPMAALIVSAFLIKMNVSNFRGPLQFYEQEDGNAEYELPFVNDRKAFESLELCIHPHPK
jgi:hypothetical protein